VVFVFLFFGFFCFCFFGFWAVVRAGGAGRGCDTAVKVEEEGFLE